MNKVLRYGIAATIACMTTGLAVAGEYDSGSDEYGHSDTRAWHDKGMGHTMMMGKHAMSGTIETIDQKTGWLKVKTGEGSLNVHFPPAAIKDLKAGDEITVHLSFTKGGEKGEMKGMKDGEMMK